MILSHRVLLRRFLLLKLVTVLLFPQGAVLPLVAGAMYSLQARSWLRSPHISTKPSNVLLRQLALADSLLLLYGALRLGAAAACIWVDVAGPVKTTETSECQRVFVLCQWLLDAQHLASLLLLGLLGLEATLVCHWPLQTRALRTSHFAQLGCGLVWALVLMEVLVSQAGSVFVWDTAAGLQVNPRALTQPRQHAALSHSLPTFSVYLRRVLWLTDSWLHYFVLCNKPKRAKSCFH